MKIDDPKPSATLEGFYDVNVHLTYNGATKDESYYVSKDGKNIVKGETYDVAQQPVPKQSRPAERPTSSPATAPERARR